MPQTLLNTNSNPIKTSFPYAVNGNPTPKGRFPLRTCGNDERIDVLPLVITLFKAHPTLFSLFCIINTKNQAINYLQNSEKKGGCASKNLKLRKKPSSPSREWEQYP